eukprot:scaffold8058_cov158-Amphora_coffeaeformis.AAC.4
MVSTTSVTQRQTGEFVYKDPAASDFALAYAFLFSSMAHLTLDVSQDRENRLIRLHYLSLGLSTVIATGTGGAAARIGTLRIHRDKRSRTGSSDSRALPYRVRLRRRSPIVRNDTDSEPGNVKTISQIDLI